MQHKSTTLLFDVNKVEQYFVDEKTIVVEGHGISEVVSGSSVEEIARKFSETMSVSAATSWGPTAIAAGVEREMSGSNSRGVSTNFSQLRKSNNLATLTLPDCALDTAELQALVRPNILQQLKACADAKTADYMISNLGIGYFNAMTLGGVMTVTMTSSEIKQVSAQDMKTSVEMEVRHLATSLRAEKRSELNSMESKRDTNKNVSIKVFGGDIGEALDSDNSRWTATVKKEPVMTKFSTVPLYELVRGSPGYAHLKRAFDKEIEKRKTELKRRDEERQPIVAPKHYYICRDRSEASGKQATGECRAFLYGIVKSAAPNYGERVAYLCFPVDVFQGEHSSYCLQLYIKSCEGGTSAFSVALTEAFACTHDQSYRPRPGGRLPDKIGNAVPVDVKISAQTSITIDISAAVSSAKQRLPRSGHVAVELVANRGLVAFHGGPHNHIRGEYYWAKLVRS
jgi:hypothetical protein